MPRINSLVASTRFYNLSQTILPTPEVFVEDNLYLVKPRNMWSAPADHLQRQHDYLRQRPGTSDVALPGRGTRFHQVVPDPLLCETEKGQNPNHPTLSWRAGASSPRVPCWEIDMVILRWPWPSSVKFGLQCLI